MAARSARLRAGLLVLLGAAGVALVPTPSVAAPHQTAQQVRAQIKKLEAQAADAKRAEAKERAALASLQAEQAQAVAALTQDRTTLAALRVRIAATADYAYRSGGLGGVAELANAAGPAALLSAASLDEVATMQAAQLQAATQAEQRVEATRARLAANAAATAKTLKHLADSRARIADLLGRAHTLLGTLDPATESLAQLGRASRSTSRAALPRVSANRAAVLRFAFAQLGKPYSYGAAGPSSYDCSGLTMAAWATAGVALPHNAAAQQSMLPRVTGPLQPGDLVFEGSPAYHVGIYIGGGKMIHAPHTGDVVRISPLPAYSSAGRP